MRLVDLLLVLTPGLPLALAALWPIPSVRVRLASLVPWAALPAVAASLLPADPIPMVSHVGVPAGITLVLDELARALLLVIASLWALVGTFARSYHATDPAKGRFFGLFLLTMAGNLGLVVAGDPLTFYLFFSWMTFAAYGLVVHARGAEAFRAGRVYIVLAILGEVGVLGALLMIGGVGGVPAFGPDMEALWTTLVGAGRAELVAGLVVAGFGIKAGLVPLHVWLPLAHPVAPTPASALLSGTMIKAGVLAWLRFLPGDQLVMTTGMVLLLIGLVGMLYGIALGLAQEDAKTVLAYSSVSQMGFMAAGVGLWLGADGPAPVAVVAVVAYAMHHAVAKTVLFLSVGIADRLREDTGPAMVRRRRAVLLTAGAALPAMALAGAPWSAGHHAKTRLKDAVEAIVPEWPLAGYLVLAAFGTTLLVARFLVLLHRRAVPDGTDDGTPGSEHRPVAIGMGGMVLPWATLLLAVLSGPWWMSELFHPPGAPPSPPIGYGWAEAAGPVVAGMAVAWAAWTRPTLLHGLHRLRIPAGDLVVLVERGLIHARLLGRDAPSMPGAAVRAGLRPARASRADRDGNAPGREGDLRLARGRMLVVFLLVLVTALASLLD